MTKLLEMAMAKINELPDEDQDAVAAHLLALVDKGQGVIELDDEARSAIREGLEQARRGEFVPDEEIEALWNRHSL
jgi:predicted transcriptional regulator